MLLHDGPQVGHRQPDAHELAAAGRPALADDGEEVVDLHRLAGGVGQNGVPVDVIIIIMIII